MPNLTAVIMAAGKGTRMKSKLPKVMHQMAGKPLIEHVLRTVHQVGVERPIVILGHGREAVEAKLSDRCELVFQAEQLGTGHALIQALPNLDGVENVLVLSGDQPLLNKDTLIKLLQLHQDEGAAATVLTAYFKEPFGYGRIVKKGKEFVGIVEEKDATPEECLIQEINTGTYCFKVAELKRALSKIKPQNAQGEYYLTEVFNIFLGEGTKVVTYCTPDANEALGINSRLQLAEAEKIYRQRILQYWMDEGVTVVDPATTYIDDEVVLAQDVTLLPFTFLKGNTQIGEDSVIGPQVTLESCFCGAGCEISHTVARDAFISEHCMVGPYAYLRPGTYLETGVKVGDFVEIKNSRIGVGSKVPHLSYIGDAQIGKSVNIGAGTITCNYDGIKKSQTTICDNAFIGSNTNLVAPVEIGEGAMTGAGSTITKDVPARALVVERSKQVVREQFGKENK